MEAELQIFTGPVERYCERGTSALHTPGSAEVRMRNFRDLHRPGRAEAELQLFTGQVDWKCGSGTSDFTGQETTTVKILNWDTGKNLVKVAYDRVINQKDADRQWRR